MISLPTQGTIIAPTSLHLPLYQKLLKENKHYLSLQVLSLSSFLNAYFPKKESNIKILYTYKEALASISKSNDFYKNINDANFLRDCLHFMKLAKTYKITNWPTHTNKEKDLKEILEILQTIPLAEDFTPSFSSLKDVYILRCPYSGWNHLWIEQLIQAGAQWLDCEVESTIDYVAMSTSRKQAQWIAETIVEKNWNADDIFISCCDSKDPLVLEQMFNTYQIPYTILKDQKTNPICLQWACALRWIQEQTKKSFLNLVKAFEPKANYFENYLTLFPEAFPSFMIDHPDYEKNNFLDEKEWEQILNFEKKTKEWLNTHSIQWDFNSWKEIATFIQEYNQPTKENLACMQKIQLLCSDAIPHIHSKEDLSILIHQIENLTQVNTAASIHGVVIGSLKELSNIRPIVFLTSANASNYPQLEKESGIFDETYLMDIPFPSLNQRLNLQKEGLKASLKTIEHLIVSLPQADYQGKKYENSVEMDRFIGNKPGFVTIEESDIYTQPSFSLSKEKAQSLFLKEGKIYGSVSSFEKYVHCPLSYFLDKGLHLKEQKDWSDLSIRGSILHEILESMVNDHQEDYVLCTKDEIKRYIEKEYTWFEQAFPSQKEWVASQKDALLINLINIFNQLKTFQKQWHMPIHEQEKRLTYELEWDDYIISLVGYIDRIDESDTSFVIFDYKSGDKKLIYKEFQQGLSLQLVTYAIAYEKESHKIPLGNYYISLRKKPEEQSAIKLNYQGKKNNWIPLEVDSFEEKYQIGDKFKGWNYGDLGIYSDEEKQFFKLSSKKSPSPSFEQAKEQWKEIIGSISEDILSGNILPEHQKDGCKYCTYQQICRNAKQEVEKELRVKGEENE